MSFLGTILGEIQINIDDNHLAFIRHKGSEENDNNYDYNANKELTNKNRLNTVFQSLLCG